MALPMQEINASPADHFFQQGTPLRTVLKQIGNHYKVAIIFEEGLIQGKNTDYKFNPANTTLEKSLGELLAPLDDLLASFVRQRRMKLSGEYKPCYRIVA